jgi:hypothetical protein
VLVKNMCSGAGSAQAIFSSMAELIFPLVALLFGFTCGYGIRAWISRRRRRHYRQVARDRSESLVEDDVNLTKRLWHPAHTQRQRLNGRLLEHP